MGVCCGRGGDPAEHRCSSHQHTFTVSQVAGFPARYIQLTGRGRLASAFLGLPDQADGLPGAGACFYGVFNVRCCC